MRSLSLPPVLLFLSLLQTHWESQRTLLLFRMNMCSGRTHTHTHIFSAFWLHISLTVCLYSWIIPDLEGSPWILHSFSFHTICLFIPICLTNSLWLIESPSVPHFLANSLFLFSPLTLVSFSLISKFHCPSYYFLILLSHFLTLTHSLQVTHTHYSFYC